MRCRALLTAAGVVFVALVGSCATPDAGGVFIDPTGPFPRPLLVVQVVDVRAAETGDDDETVVYSFWLHDPLRPGPGWRRAFSGPGRQQYCTFVTPLAGGRGIATGRTNPGSDDPNQYRLFWIDLAGGRVGPTILADFTSMHWVTGTELRFAFRDRLYRYDLDKTTLTPSGPSLLRPRRLDEHTVLGVTRKDDVLHASLVRMDRDEVEDLGPLPDGVTFTSLWQSDGVYPAGPGCEDGVYALQGPDLWFLPTDGETWIWVLANVSVRRLAGGMPPALAVEYLGNERFAVARSAPVSGGGGGGDGDGEDRSAGDRSVIMLVDARTGKVLEETSPTSSGQRLSVAVPASWHGGGGDGDAQTDGSVVWDESRRRIVYCEDGHLELGRGDRVALSSDRRFAAVVGRLPVVEVIDGVTGVVTTVPLPMAGRGAELQSLEWVILESAPSESTTEKR